MDSGDVKNLSPVCARMVDQMSNARKAKSFLQLPDLGVGIEEVELKVY